MIRKIYLGRKRIICRLPEAAGFGSGWVILNRRLHSLSGQTVMPSVLYPASAGMPPRHFWVKNGEARFLSDDAVCPGQTMPLQRLPRFWLAQLLDLLPPGAQPGTQYAKASRDY